MNKNLEKEYKLNIESELPDLWSRIEAALPEKEFIDKTEVATGVENVVSFEKVKEERQSNSGNKKDKRKMLATISGITVAAAVILVALPAIILAGRLTVHKTENSAPAAANDSIAGDMYINSERGEVAESFAPAVEESAEAEADYSYDYEDEWATEEAEACDDGYYADDASPEKAMPNEIPQNYIYVDTYYEVQAVVDEIDGSIAYLNLTEDASDLVNQDGVFAVDMSTLIEEQGKAKVSSMVGKEVLLCLECYEDEAGELLYFASEVTVISN